jgi:cytochrome c-type biogenesis protein CcmH/NrfG
MTTGTSRSRSPARFGALLGLVLCAAALLAMLYETTLKGRPAWERVLRRTPLASDESLAGRAHEQQWAGRLEGPEGAVEAFTMALRRDPASPYRWCELGETLLEAGRVGPARYCLRRAVELGGGTPSVLMRAANLHFRLDRRGPAGTRRCEVKGETA